MIVEAWPAHAEGVCDDAQIGAVETSRGEHLRGDVQYRAAQHVGAMSSGLRRGAPLVRAPRDGQSVSVAASRPMKTLYQIAGRTPISRRENVKGEAPSMTLYL